MRLLEAIRLLWLYYIKGVPEGMPLEKKNHPYCICWYMYASDYDDEFPGTIVKLYEAPIPPKEAFAWNYYLFKAHAIYEKQVNGRFKTGYPCIVIGDKVGLYRIARVWKDDSSHFADRAPWDDGLSMDFVLVDVVSRSEAQWVIDSIKQWNCNYKLAKETTDALL